MKRWVIDYEMDGSRWGAEIMADDWQDAERRLRAMGSGTVSGEHIATIPVPGPFRRLVEALLGIRD